MEHPTAELRVDQVRKPGSFPSEDHFIVRRENSAASQIVHSCIQTEKDINIVRLPGEVFDLLCPIRLCHCSEESPAEARRGLAAGLAFAPCRSRSFRR